MKQKLSVSVDETTLAKLDEKLKDGLFRNKSHVVEFALKRLFEGE